MVRYGGGTLDAATWDAVAKGVRAFLPDTRLATIEVIDSA